MNVVIVLFEMSARRILEILLLWSLSAWYTTFSAAGSEHVLLSLLYYFCMISLSLLSPHGAVFKEKRSALNNFELLDYDPSELLAQHERIRRGATQSSTIRFSFSAYNK